MYNPSQLGPFSPFTPHVRTYHVPQCFYSINTVEVFSESENLLEFELTQIPYMTDNIAKVLHSDVTTHLLTCTIHLN